MMKSSVKETYLYRHLSSRPVKGALVRWQRLREIVSLQDQREAEVVLRTFWTANPTDEDALSLLMRLLAQHNRPQEALRLFAYTQRLLSQEEGRQVSARMHMLAQQIQDSEESG